MLLMRELVFGDSEPSQPVAFVGPGPERGVARPQAAHLTGHFPILDRLLKLRVDLSGQAVSLRIHFSLRDIFTLGINGIEQLVERFGDQLDGLRYLDLRNLLPQHTALFQLFPRASSCTTASLA